MRLRSQYTNVLYILFITCWYKYRLDASPKNIYTGGNNLTNMISGGTAFGGVPIGILLLNARYPLMPGNMAHAASFDFPVRYKVVDLPTGWWQDLNEEKYQTFIGAAKGAAGRGRSSNYHRLRIIRGLAGAGSRGVGHSHMHLSPADGAHAFQNHREAEKAGNYHRCRPPSQRTTFFRRQRYRRKHAFCDRGTGHLFRIHGLHPLSEEDGNGYSPLSAAGGTDCKKI